MANQTLEKMQEIEAAADKVLAGYETDIEQLRRQADEQISQMGQAYDQETQRLAAELEESSQKQLAALRQDVLITVRQNEAAVEAALNDKKAALVQSIIDKVVDEYGH
ncbi:hypothetical protein ACVRXQ_09050 [Streptococcus panodentis]|uniref:V-type ATP synthase subunit G n=1 Tax=Streptococcus panodentis TaxID=1581472 RepID=A0ABS5AWQ0_9STRE|nr:MULTISPECIES: hypothetical protein [Streptococcus]KXT77544.1 V-type ATP synthase subunit G [Streptococcus sp. DD11]MBP2621013.1 hypothetical protein [Streptococcus panodentis]